MGNRVIYITSFYNEKHDARRAELEFCLTNVLENKAINLVILVHDNHDAVHTDIPLSKYLEKGKLLRIFLTHRPTFKDFFAIANEDSNEGDVIIIANTDICPEYGAIEQCLDIKPNECYALSRHDYKEDGSKVHFDRLDSQDLWVFQAPIRNVHNCEFMLGTAGTDNAIADRLRYAGYKVINPSKTIQFNHFHLSGVNNYNPDHKVDKPYLLITPHKLGEEPNYHSIP